MKQIIKTLACVQLIAMLAAALGLEARVAEAPLVFRATLSGEESYEFQGSTVHSTGTGSGNATHLGRFTATWNTVADGSLPDNPGHDSFHLISANGDSLFIEASGHGDLTDFPVIYVVETGTITGGTGRFEGASGTLLIQRVQIVTDSDSDTTSGTIIGTIVIPSVRK